MIFLILLAYITLVFIVFRLFVPFLGYSKVPLSAELPKDLEDKISVLNKESINNADYLKKVFSFVIDKYSGSRLKTVIYFWYAFKNPFYIHAGFSHCTLQNYLIRTMLIKSGRFSEDDIKVITVPLNFFIHQYLKVRLEDRWVSVDPWANSLGVPFGKNAFLFK